MLNFAIIGCGRIANKVVDGIVSNSKKAKLVAICDILEDKMDQIEKRYIEKTNIKNEIVKNSNYKELLDKVKVDVVIVSTESGYHEEIGLYFLENRVNVIIEKLGE